MQRPQQTTSSAFLNNQRIQFERLYYGPRDPSLCLNDPERLKDMPNYPVILVNSPIGVGKTRMLVEFFVKELSGDKTSPQIVFLTQSNTKAREIEDEVLREIKSLPEGGNEPSVVRLFGDKEIPEERENNSDIKKCVKLAERKRNIDASQSAWKICEACKMRNRCPYFRRGSIARTTSYDMIISSHAQMQHEGFFLSKIWTNNERGKRILVLDEDGHSNFVLSQSIDDDVLRTLEAELPANIKIKSDETQRAILESILVEVKRTMIAGGAPDSQKIKTKAERLIEKVIAYNCHLKILPQEKGGFKVFLFPKPFTNSRTNNPIEKIIVADATAMTSELQARFQLEHVPCTYDVKRDGFPKPKGKVFQIAENISKHKTVSSGKLIRAELEQLLRSFVNLKEEYGLSRDDTWLIGPRFLIEDKSFRKRAGLYGFKTDETLYHGYTRGRNVIENKDIIVFGSNFPNTAEAEQSALKKYGALPKYTDEIFQEFALWTDIAWFNGQKFNMTELRTDLSFWENRNLGKTKSKYGPLSRKIMIESVTQSLRSRYYWHDTKTVVVCQLPLTAFGVALNDLREDFSGRRHPVNIYRHLQERMVNEARGLTMEEIRPFIPLEAGDKIKTVANWFKDKSLPVCEAEGYFYPCSASVLDQLKKNWAR